MSGTLNVYWDRRLTGADAHALSVRLPLRPEPFFDDAARPFFSNLLPEARIRELIAKGLGVSEKNDFKLLEELGGECAGATARNRCRTEGICCAGWCSTI